ncbi:granzyme-like protein 1 [Melozone crissalis]|uniref:granzyme-like protein 1 n=1 Tax=Melozone crissalis TaxID=40204 RepID=UPI0023DB30F7|nr:granzyme-like protein 1 [Melozone crissalis]
MLLLLLLTNAFVLLPWAGAGRIIGGREAEAHSRPYMAYLEVKNKTNSTVCGGFLIRPDAVLSAAHCVDMKGTVKVTVILGAHNVRKQEQSQQKIPVVKKVIHPEYSRKDLKNDIVLLKLKEKANITKNVQCISIAENHECVRAGDLCTVSGWGWTSKKKVLSDVLMEVDLEVQNEEMCEELSSKYQRQSMICVGEEDSKTLAAPGDSGGPLVCNEKAHGIVSHGCGGRLSPDVFTRISHFEPWIRKKLKGFSRKSISCSPSSD